MRRTPALSIFLTATRKSASAFSNSLAAAAARVRLVYVLMSFLAIRLCIRRLTFCFSRLIADGVLGIALVRCLRTELLSAAQAVRGPARGKSYHTPEARFKPGGALIQGPSRLR